MNLERLAEAIADAAPRLGTFERRLAVIVYRLLAEGEPVSMTTLADCLSIPGSRVREALASWNPGVLYDDDGSVIGFWGLSLPEMPHRLEVDGRRLSTWCAWDTLFIPQILQTTARVASTCPVTGERISLIVGPSGVESLTPAGAVVSLLVPTGAFDDRIRLNFCDFVHFFSSAGAGVTWTSEHPGTFVLSVDDAYQLGRLTNERTFAGGLLESDPGR